MTFSGLNIDNFAGGGGASTGIEWALGRPIDIAINHDPEAIAMHMENHPDTRHHCQSILSIDPLAAVEEALALQGHNIKAAGDYPINLIWFSPDCKHHSKAKGGKPREKNIRDLAWVVVHWIERLQDAYKRAGGDARKVIRCIMLENVEEFRKWGPLDDRGMPIKEREGEEFDLFVRRIRRRGAKVEFRELVGCHYGARTSRKRLYMIIRFDGEPVVWPVPSHGKPDCPDVLRGKLQPWGTAADCIDWSIECPSIFERARPLKEATMRRIAHGTMRYVVNSSHPFLVPVTNSGWNPDRAWPSTEPLRTVTTAKGGEFAAVDAMIVPHITKFRGGAIGSDAGNPMPTITANGNPARPAGAQPLALADATLVEATFLDRQFGRSLGSDVQSPMPATTAGGGGKTAAVATFLSQFRGSNRTASAGNPAEPSRSITAGGQHQAVVCAHMEQANTGAVGHPVRKPISTIMGKGSNQRLVETTLLEEGDLPPEMMDRAVRVAAFLVKYYGSGDGQHQAADIPLGVVTTLARFAVVTVTINATTYVIVDIGMRMLTPRELARAQGFPDDYVLDPIGPNGKPLSKAAQIRMIGNSVCPHVARALVAANLTENAEVSEAA